MEHYSDMWWAEKSFKKKSRQTLEVWHKTRLVQAFKAFSFTLRLLSQCIRRCLPRRFWFRFILSPFPTDASGIFYFHFLLIISLFYTVYFQMRMSNAFDLGPSWPHFPPSIRHFPQSALSQCMTRPWIKHYWWLLNNTRKYEVKGE